MSNILLTTLDYPPKRGGVARYLFALKQVLDGAVEVLYWRTQPSRWRLWRELCSEGLGYDALWVSHIFPVGTMAYLTKFFTGRPYVVFLHGMDFDLARRDRQRRFLAKRILRRAKRVVTNSRALAREVAAFARIPEPLVVYPSVPEPFVQASREKHAEPNPHFVTLLTVSRLVERKGHIQVLEAIRNMPNVRYLIVGDGPYFRKIFYRIKDLQLETRVQMIPDADDARLPAIYQSADVFIMPTRKTKTDREGFGIAYLEAQLFGLPVIASNHPGVDEAVLHGATGLLIPEDEQALRQAIAQLVEDADMRKRLGAAGRARVLESFRQHIQFTKLRELL